MDIASLQLEIDNGSANAAIDATGAKLDALAARGERAAALQGSAVHRVAQEYARLSSGDLANATQWYDRMYGSSKKAAGGMDELTQSTHRTIGGFGRLAYSFGALDSRIFGTSTIVGRFGSVFSNLFLGGAWTVGIGLGLAAIGAAWKLLGNQADELADKVSAAMKRMHAETLTAQLAMGDLQLARANADVMNARAGLTDASKVRYDAKTGLASGTEGNVGAAQKAMTAANAELFLAQQNKSQINYQMKGDAVKDYADNLALLVKSNHATHEERQRALALYKSDLSDIAALGKSQTDNIRRAQLIRESTTLKDALFPKEHAGSHKKPSFLDHITTGSVALNAVVDRLAARYKQLVAEADKLYAITGKSGMSGVKDELLAGAGPLQGIVDHAKVLEALGPSKELDRVKAAADKMGRAEIADLAKSNLGWKEKSELIAVVQRQLDEIGDKTIPESSWMKGLGNVISGMRTGADAANLFGGPRGAQWGNILNTGMNAAENIKAAKGAGAISMKNFIPDAQAVLSVISLGKEIFHLGGISHEAKDAINQAAESLKMMLSIFHDSVTHNSLQGLLDNAQSADDERRASINKTLSGKKNETARTAAFAQDAQDYVIQQQQIRSQYAQNQTYDNANLESRKDRALGLTYAANLNDLKTRQLREWNQAILDGKDANYMATLKIVDLAEAAALANSALTQLSNAPAGFFAERYAPDFVTKQPWPTATPPSTPNAPTNNFDLTGSTFHIDGSGDPEKTFHVFMNTLRKKATAVVGINAPLGSSLDYLG